MNLTRLAFITFLLAFCVVTLGALTRLLDAGLGCPDWPGCYGQLTPPSETLDSMSAGIDSGKAWMEMIHRYAAGLLGLLILCLTVMIESRKDCAAGTKILSRILLLWVVAQALFGMWTVTLRLQPQVVTVHLLGGMLLLVMLWCLYKQLSPDKPVEVSHRLYRFSAVMLVLLSVQIALGGWTSSQYAGLACPDFPTCQGQWLPTLQLDRAFDITRFIDTDHSGGLLALDARVTIQLVHRLFAMLLTLGMTSLCLILWTCRPLRRTACWLLGLTAIQVSLGIANAVLLLPLPLALAHNTGAALLLLCLVNLFIRLQPPGKEKAAVKFSIDQSNQGATPCKTQ